MLKGDVRIARTENALGNCLTSLGKYKEAEPLLASSLAIIRAEDGKTSEDARQAEARLAALYKAEGKKPGKTEAVSNLDAAEH